MSVDFGAARYISTVGGASVYFCRPGCKRAFEEDPARFPGDSGTRI